MHALQSLPTPAKAELVGLLEEKRRRKARRKVAEFCRQVKLPGAPIADAEDCEEFYPLLTSPAEHHNLLLNTLQRVADGEIKRLMIFMPPGSAKSTYASVAFPSWYMGAFPGSNIISASYNSTLAAKFGRKCRSLVQSLEYSTIFSTTLAKGNTAVDDWSLQNLSTYMCGGLLSGITGNRADGLVIDDPIKGAEAAASDTIREKTWETYKSDCRTRLKPNAWQVIIQTRWHEDDLSGRILPENYAGESGWIMSRDGEWWFVLCLPAQCYRDDDPLGRPIGGWLWTEWFTPEFWENEKRVQGSRNWNALYQQKPTPDEGDYFLREWFRYFETMPANLRIYGTSDYAVTEGGGDYTVHMVWGIDPAENLYLLDLWREQTDSLTWVERFIGFVKQWKPAEWVEEKGQITKSMGPLITKRQAEEKAYCYRKQLSVAHGDKEMRAQAIRGRMAQGKVYFPKHAPWLSDLEHELLVFPNGKHDDQVDAMALIGMRLAMTVGASEPKAEEPAQYGAKTFDDLLKISQKRRKANDD